MKNTPKNHNKKYNIIVDNILCMYKKKLNYFDWFSNWIFIWFILYILNIIPFNPSIALIINTTVVIILIIICIKDYKNVLTKINISKYINHIIIFIYTKILPFIILYTYNDIKISYYDIIFYIILFIQYIVYLQISNCNVFYVYNKLYKKIMNKT
jgi:hypothetical protein